MVTKPQSPVLALLDITWRATNASTSHSYERLNHAMRQALTLAVGAGFEFAEADLAHIAGNYRSGYWIGSSVEWIYALAVAMGNVSVIKAFEVWKNRQPFIADDVEIVSHGGFTHGSNCRRERERLCVGAKFLWQGKRCEVTSFAEDSSSLIAVCRVMLVSELHGRHVLDTKTVKKHRITREDIIVDRAERKERDALMVKLTALGKAGDCSAEIMVDLGCDSKERYATVPLKKIRKVVERWEKKVGAKAEA